MKTAEGSRPSSSGWSCPSKYSAPLPVSKGSLMDAPMVVKLLSPGLTGEGTI
jgi:hypothetical protein